MKSITKIFVPALIIFMIFVGCHGQQEIRDNSDINKLFNGMCRITSSYMDSMNNAKDSALLIGLMERYEASITELNFSVVADTDLHLSEGQNDTIYQMLDSIRRLFDIRMDSFLHGKNRVDSIPIDSLANVNAAPPSGNSGNQISK